MSARRGYADGPYGQIHYREVGAGGQPLILLHQSPLTGSMFDAAAGLLAQAGYHVVAPDTPGYGLSDTPAQPIDISGYASCLPSVLDHFGFETTSILGHHTGAVIAARFAIEHPQKVSAMVLNGVAILSPEERAFFDGLKFAPLVPQADGSHLSATWQQRLTTTPGWTDINAMHRYCVDMLAIPDRYFRAFDAVFAHDIQADIRAIGVPTALLTNTGEDLYGGTQRAHAMRPDFAFHALEDGTHDIVDEQPQAWAEAVASLLAKVSGR